MSNETTYAYSTQVTAAAASAALTSNNINTSAECSALTSANHGNYPLADAVLFASFSTSVSSASQVIVMYRRDKNIDGANHAPVPSTTSGAAYSAHAVGAFIVPAFTASSSGYFSCPDIPLAQDCEFYIENKTNATITSTWTLKMKPKTFTPAA